MVGLPCAEAARGRPPRRAAPPSAAAPVNTSRRLTPSCAWLMDSSVRAGVARLTAVRWPSSRTEYRTPLPRESTHRTPPISARLRGAAGLRLASPTSEGNDHMARIGIDLARRIGTVDRRIFGN